MNVLVVPTNRPDRIVRVLDEWRPWPWDRIVIVEDAPETSAPWRTTGAQSGWREGDVVICSWRQIDDDLPAPWIISRGDSAIRSYGFWKAWSIGADYIFTLDDDCFPVDRDHVTRHLDNLEATPAWHSTVDGLRVRGLPYSNVGTLRNIRVSMGLWLGHPDIDAIQTLARRGAPADDVLDRGVTSRLMPADQ